MAKRMGGIINIKKIHPWEFISGRKSYLQLTGKKVLHFSIFLMEKYNRLSLITAEKKRVYQKNTIKREILLPFLNITMIFLSAGNG